MGFYDTLKNSSAQNNSTPIRQVEENYETTVQYLFQRVLSCCTAYSQQGKRTYTAYTTIEYDPDKNYHYLVLKERHPQEVLNSVQERWAWIESEKKKEAPAEIRNDKNKLLAFIVNNIFLDQSKALRDRILNDLRTRLVREGFPANCVSTLDMPIALPTSYGFFSGKPTAFSQVCTCYYVKVSVTW